MLHTENIIGKKFYFIDHRTNKILEGICLAVGVTELGYIYASFNTVEDKQWFEGVDVARVFETSEQALEWLGRVKPIQDENRELKEKLDAEISNNITRIIGEPPLGALVKEIREAQEG